MKRLPGWESRLAKVLEDAARRPYQLGEHDCFRLACMAVEAMTGADLWAGWAGRYRTKREALRLLAEYAAEASELAVAAGPAFTRAFSRLFGGAPVCMGRARRGDVAEYVDGRGEQHLGVVNGADVAVLLEGGAGYVPRSSCVHAWRIG